MVRYLKHIEIDFEKWDNCLLHSKNGLIYAYSFYLNTACPGWSGLVWNDYEAVMPLPFKKKYGISYIYTPFFIQQLGVFHSNDVAVDNFIDAIPKTFRLIEYNLNWKNKSLKPEIQFWTTHFLSLNQTYEKLYSKFDRTLRNNIKKAELAGLNLNKKESLQSIIQLFRENRGKSLDKLMEQDYARLDSIFKVCELNNQACVWGVYEGDSLLAGGLFVWSNNHYIFLFSGNSDRGKETGALPYLLTKFIQEHAENDSIFDFEGSNQESLARFYKSFGSVKIEYPRYEKRRFPLF